MPTHRGIKLNIASSADFNICPEFPHPESSQFTYRSPDFDKSSDGWKSPSISHESKADRLLGRQSVVSVYIPSFPGTRFWLRYSIEEIAVHHSKFYYFKLGANGEDIISWGVNAKKNPEGQIMRTLCEPRNKLNIDREDISPKKTIIESCWFLFPDKSISPQSKNYGFIEVKVFRVCGRKLKLPLLPRFKNQNNGIKFLSQGLLAEPCKCDFYDWYLKDPTDNPFAIFKFHYRSWDLLQKLKITSLGHPGALLKLSSDQSSFKSQHKSETEKRGCLLNAEEIHASYIAPFCEDQIQKRRPPKNGCKYSGSSNFCETIPPGRISAHNMWSSLVVIDKPITTSPKSSTKLLEYETTSNSGTKIFLMNHGHNQNPPSNLSRKPNARQHLSASSSISCSNSITPSLASQIEDIHNTAEIGTASVLLISSSPSLPEPQSHVPKVVLKNKKT